MNSGGLEAVQRSNPISKVCTIRHKYAQYGKSMPPNNWRTQTIFSAPAPTTFRRVVTSQGRRCKSQVPTIHHHRLPLSVSGHETRVLGNRSCRFGGRGALNGVSLEIMQMYTHHLTGNSRSVPSRTWVSPQWTCCRWQQQSGEGLDTHIIVLWHCTECKGLAIGDTSCPTQEPAHFEPTCRK